MKNAEKWAKDYANLSEGYQLEIAEQIIEELQFNERISTSTYDGEKSASVRATFEQLRAYLEEEVEGLDVEELFERISSLSDANRQGLADAIQTLLEEYFSKQEQQDKEAVCEAEGHDFTPWNYHEWTSYERTIIDHQWVDNYPIPHKEWTRKCNRCGCAEKVDREPEDAREARLKKEKSAEIKALRKRLRELEKK